jgi:EAL domain-containing protein (putative c-di-GMP-specific phosphodiesterase class I)/DNA-binding CsgD family transcriptional regulator
MRILALDDEPGIGKLIGRVASGLGMTVEAPATASEFRSLFLESRPDAVILDLQLGEDDGIEQLRFLSTTGYGGPILLLSGLDERLVQTAQRVGQGLGLAVAAALTKPIRAHTLREALELLRPTAAWTPSHEDLRRAIEARELTLHLQPIVDATSRRLIKAEALGRWHHSGHGLVPPGVFVPVAESNPELADALTLWAVEEAGRCLQQLGVQGLDLPIAVNISGVNLRDLRFPDRVGEALRRTSTEPSRITLELTETAVFQDAQHATDVLLRLRLKGFELALDDFGTGYSSLRLLRQMPFSALKIDRSFVSDVLIARDAASMVGGIADLARRMGLQSIAEGVETEETAAALADLGADALQGYLFGKPVAVEELARCWRSPGGDLKLRPVDPAALVTELTGRELEVLRGVLNGKTNKVIAQELGISPRTVEIHRGNMMNRLGAKTVSDVIRIGLAAGIGDR